MVVAEISLLLYSNIQSVFTKRVIDGTALAGFDTGDKNEMDEL